MHPCVHAVSCVRVWGVSQRARSTAPTVLAREMHRPALRPHRSAIVRLRSGAVASRSGAFRIAAFRCGGGGPRGWHGRAAVFGAPPLRHRESAFIREGQSIRRYGALGLVAMPPCANRIRPGGVLPLAASDLLWPRGRHASPLARYRHMSVFAARVPRALREQGECAGP
jgi:hypothetical protein